MSEDELEVIRDFMEEHEDDEDEEEEEIDFRDSLILTVLELVVAIDRAEGIKPRYTIEYVGKVADGIIKLMAGEK